MQQVRSLGIIEDSTAAQEATLRVAIATSDLRALNAHFGSAKKLAIFDVTAAGSQFVRALEFGEVSGGDGSHDDLEDRIGPKVTALSGCDILFCLAIGGPAAARLVGARVHPIKVRESEPIDAVLERVRTMMKGNPPPWLRKAMQGKRERPSFLDEEDAS